MRGRPAHGGTAMDQTCRIAGTREGVAQALAGFDAFARQAGLAESARWRFQVALDEILSNVVRHGRPADAPAPAVVVRFAVEDDDLRVEVSDTAPPFNPLTAPAPDTAAPLEAREPGGLGIALVVALMDDVQYERRGNENHVIMKRRVRDEPPPAGTDR